MIFEDDYDFEEYALESEVADMIFIQNKYYMNTLGFKVEINEKFRELFERIAVIYDIFGDTNCKIGSDDIVNCKCSYINSIIRSIDINNCKVILNMIDFDDKKQKKKIRKLLDGYTDHIKKRKGHNLFADDGVVNEDRVKSNSTMYRVMDLFDWGINFNKVYKKGKSVIVEFAAFNRVFTDPESTALDVMRSLIGSIIGTIGVPETTECYYIGEFNDYKKIEGVWNKYEDHNIKGHLNYHIDIDALKIWDIEVPVVDHNITYDMDLTINFDGDKAKDYCKLYNNLKALNQEGLLSDLKVIDHFIRSLSYNYDRSYIYFSENLFTFEEDMETKNSFVDYRQLLDDDVADVFDKHQLGANCFVDLDFAHHIGKINELNMEYIGNSAKWHLKAEINNMDYYTLHHRLISLF